MTTEPDLPGPAVGDWYADPQGMTFKVVAVDEQDNSVDVQYFDGTLEALDLDTWADRQLTPVEPQEDWSGPLDMQHEDYGVDLEEEHHDLWVNPLDHLDQ